LRRGRLFLDTKIPLEELNFSVGYWFSGDVSFSRSSILSGQSFSDLLYESAKKRALQWEKKREKIKASGKDEAYIKALGKVDEENLQIYYQELAEIAELKQTGVTDLPIRKEYKITDEDYKIFYQYLAVWHCLAIGLYADILFLGNSWKNTPLLPSLIPYLLEKYRDNPLLTSEFWQEAISSIVKVYEEFYDSLKSNFSYCAPEIRMKLALSLANLPSEYKYLALEQGNKAFSDWLEINSIPLDKIFDANNYDDFQVLKRIIYQENKPFFDSLKSLLEKIQGAERIDGSKTDRIGSLLVGWEFLNRFDSIPHLPIIESEKLSAIMETNPKKSDRVSQSSVSSQTTTRKNTMSNQNASNPLQNLKGLFQNRPEVLKMLDARELDLAGLESEAYIREQKKRKLYPEPVNFYATGRTGAGKTSLGNTLLDSGTGKSPMKSTGHQDCTNSVQYFALASNLRYFDLPGAGSNEQFENINRGALLIEQIIDEDEEIYPVKDLRILDFSEYETKGFKEKLIAVEEWQSKENQKNVSADIILYVVAPHMMFIGDDKRYLRALLKSQKQQNQKIIFALNIHRTKDGTSIIPTPQNLEDARKIITEIYQKFYPNTIPLIVEIDSLKGTGVSEITELICQILPSEKIGNMQQALKDELKEVAKKERSYRYRQTLISIASRLATERVDTPLGKGVLSEAYAAVCSYGISIFVEEDARIEMEKAVYELVDEYAAQTKMSRARVIEVMTKDVQEKEVTTEKISGYIPEYEDFSITDEIPDYHEETIKVKRSAIERGGLGFVEGVVQVVASPISLVQGIVSAFGGMKEEDIVGNKIHQEFDRDAYKNENVIKAGTRKVTRIEQRFKGMKEQKQTVTEKIPYVVEKMQKVGEKFIQGGYPVVENLLAIGLGIESDDLSVDLSQNFEQVVELGQKQVKTVLSRYEAKINQLAESSDPDLAEAEIIKILEGALLK
jgi:hypothetical protein